MGAPQEEASDFLFSSISRSICAFFSFRALRSSYIRLFSAMRSMIMVVVIGEPLSTTWQMPIFSGTSYGLVPSAHGSTGEDEKLITVHYAGYSGIERTLVCAMDDHRYVVVLDELLGQLLRSSEDHLINVLFSRESG